MQISWFLVVGLVGLTVSIVYGKIFDSTRDWCKSFLNPLNPIRRFGELISCSMCTGIWVGAIVGVLGGLPWVEFVVLGGLVALISWPTGVVLKAIEKALEGHQEDKADNVMLLLEARARERQKRRAELRGTPPANNSEEQAHRWLDDQDRLDEEVLSDPSLVRAYEEKQREEQTT